MRTGLQDKQPKTCVRVFGGLANQMFQYAAGYAAAQRLGCKLLVDPVASKGAHASFGLDLFGIEAETWQIPTPCTLPQRLQAKLRNPKNKDKKNHRLWPGPVYKQKQFCLKDDDFDQIQPDTYLLGYFQSELFFADCQDDIRQLFSLAPQRETISSGQLELARHPHSISVHIRRGDYANNPKTTSVHGLLGKEFYDPALKLMRKIHPDGPVLIFSDDMDEADELTKDWSSRTLIRGHSREQDLYLMSQCSHHIIANSSFSWWGAWLGHNSDKTVVAPRRWFTRKKLQETYIDDLYPQGWILI